MWRAMIMSAGLCLVIVGAEAMVVDRVVLADGRAANKVNDMYNNAVDPAYSASSTYSSSPYSTTYDDLSSYAGANARPGRVITPPEWAPWGLLSAGVLTFLYASGLRVGE